MIIIFIVINIFVICVMKTDNMSNYKVLTGYLKQDLNYKLLMIKFNVIFIIKIKNL